MYVVLCFFPVFDFATSYVCCQSRHIVINGKKRYSLLSLLVTFTVKRPFTKLKYIIFFTKLIHIIYKPIRILKVKFAA